mgnify:FL=1
MQEIEGDYKTIVFLQATPPLRKNQDIDNALKKFYKTKSDSLFSCHKVNDWFDIWISNKKRILPLTVGYKSRKPRQYINKDYFQQNGSIYIFKKEIIKKYKNRLGRKIGVYQIDK